MGLAATQFDVAGVSPINFLQSVRRIALARFTFTGHLLFGFAGMHNEAQSLNVAGADFKLQTGSALDPNLTVAAQSANATAQRSQTTSTSTFCGTQAAHVWSAHILEWFHKHIGKVRCGHVRARALDRDRPCRITAQLEVLSV